jgi:acyl-CoA ligase (AMP-forming) (exosortase A-associated)
MINTLGDILKMAAAQCGSQPKVHEGKGPISYAELLALALSIGQRCRVAGLHPGARVAIVAEKSVMTLAAIFGAALEGFIAVPINPVLPLTMIRHILHDSGSSALLGRLRVVRSLTIESAPNWRTEKLPSLDLPEVNEWIAAYNPSLRTPTLQPYQPCSNDPAALLYTSGSTGLAKGVVVAHRNFVAGAASVNEYLGHTADDKLMAALPLSFDAGLSVVTSAMLTRATIVLHDYLRAEDCLRAMESHEITGLTAVPPLWVQLISSKRGYSSKLRYFANTGGSMSINLLNQLRERFPRAMPVPMYGLTEAFRSTYLPPEELERRPTSIGKAIPGAQILVLRPDGTECDCEEVGELVHRGATVALGYWNDPIRTAERFRPFTRFDNVPVSEIVVWSGDYAYKDSDGFLYFVGRKDEQMKVSGYRISPTEIEQALFSTGLVKEACIFGVDFGEDYAIKAVVYCDALQTDLIAALKRRLPSYMIPTIWHFSAEPLPRNENGKYDRALLRRTTDLSLASMHCRDASK